MGNGGKRGGGNRSCILGFNIWFIQRWLLVLSQVGDTISVSKHEIEWEDQHPGHKA